MDLSLVNKHWKEGFSYQYPLKRTLYEEIRVQLEKRFILSIVGLRRTGKTTLIKQLIENLISERQVPRSTILYYTFDEPADLPKIIDEYLRMTSHSLETPLFFFLDEIQKLDGWQNKIKVYYDHYPNIKFIISGSSSLYLRKKAESLAGRIREFSLLPLSFREFLLFRGKQDIFAKKEMFASELQRELERYVSEQFIEIIGESEEERREYLNSLLRKVIVEDIPQVYPAEQPQILWRLFKIIAANPGMLIDYRNLSSELGINEKTLSLYTEYLERAFLIKKLYNYSKNRLTSEKKLKKVYPIASSFCETDISKKVEAMVATQLPCLFFWRRTDEVDCILTDDHSLLPIEVKYKNTILEKDFKGLKKFMRTFSVQEGLVLTKHSEKRGPIRFMPVWKYFAGR